VITSGMTNCRPRLIAGSFAVPRTKESRTQWPHNGQIQPNLNLYEN